MTDQWTNKYLHVVYTACQYYRDSLVWNIIEYMLHKTERNTQENRGVLYTTIKIHLHHMKLFVLKINQIRRIVLFPKEHFTYLLIVWRTFDRKEPFMCVRGCLWKHSDGEKTFKELFRSVVHRRPLLEHNRKNITYTQHDTQTNKQYTYHKQYSKIWLKTVSLISSLVFN